MCVNMQHIIIHTINYAQRNLDLVCTVEIVKEKCDVRPVQQIHPTSFKTTRHFNQQLLTLV